MHKLFLLTLLYTTNLLCHNTVIVFEGYEYYTNADLCTQRRNVAFVTDTSCLNQLDASVDIYSHILELLGPSKILKRKSLETHIEQQLLSAGVPIAKASIEAFNMMNSLQEYARVYHMHVHSKWHPAVKDVADANKLIQHLEMLAKQRQEVRRKE